MLPQWTIEKKRNGLPLPEEEIREFISGYVAGEIPDYQMSALAMAIYFKGMNMSETGTLTRTMLESGDVVDTSSITAPKIDKHSTGGIGDKVSLSLVPLVASCGIAVPMIAGRGLGATGGTLDKLESIPGYRTRLSIPEFVRIVGDCGCAIVGQTDTLVPADRKLYALRDVTGTVPSIPLITASILSKKLAASLDGLVLDVKCGSGAFMSTKAEATALAKSLVEVARHCGLRSAALITDMNQPLGRSVGNSLEVAEAVDMLRGKGPADLEALVMTLSAHMLVMGKVADSRPAALKLLRAKLASPEPLAKLARMVSLQGGDASVVEDPGRLGSAKHRAEVPCAEPGVVHAVYAEQIGCASLLLGAGRARTTDSIDHLAGITGIKKIGETVAKGEPLAVLHSGQEARIRAAVALVRSAFVISPNACRTPPLVIDEIDETAMTPGTGQTT